MPGLGAEALQDVEIGLLITILITSVYRFSDKTQWQKELDPLFNYRKLNMFLEGVGIVFFGVSWFLFTARHWDFARTAFDMDADKDNTEATGLTNQIYPFTVVQALFFTLGIGYVGIGWVAHWVDFPMADPEKGTSAYYGNKWLWVYFVHNVAVAAVAIALLVLISMWYQDKNSTWRFVVAALVIIVVMLIVVCILRGIEIWDSRKAPANGPKPYASGITTNQLEGKERGKHSRNI